MELKEDCIGGEMKRGRRRTERDGGEGLNFGGLEMIIINDGWAIRIMTEGVRVACIMPK